MTWQEQIKDAINQRQWTQAETARRLGISPSYLGDMLAGRRRLSARVAVRLELVLQLHSWSLLYGQFNDEYEQARADIAT